MTGTESEAPLNDRMGNLLLIKVFSASMTLISRYRLQLWYAKPGFCVLFYYWFFVQATARFLADAKNTAFVMSNAPWQFGLIPKLVLWRCIAGT
jgi:hypothetical protein